MFQSPRRALRRAALFSIVTLTAFVATAAPRTTNTPPSISGTPATTVASGSSYGFRPTVNDADGDKLRFSIGNKPGWATFDRSTGALSGVPSTTGTFGDIRISVSDGRATSALPAFSITVSSQNQAPRISGTPPTTGTAGAFWSFQPTASDPDGQTLTFSIDNKPAWATFSTTSGQLQGIPTAGSWSNVVIRVTDGKLAASLPAFSITAKSAAGTATLRWYPPTQNVDGTPISNLTGYQLSYGTASRSYETTLQVTGASVTSAVIEGLASGTWYFAVKAVTADGAVSSFSTEVSKVL
jgi:hypothetical protein